MTRLLPLLAIMGLFLEAVPVAHAQATTPTVSTVAITSDPGTDDTYALGDTIEVGLTFSETVTVTGTPYLLIDVGGTNRRASYHSGTATTQLLFRYTVLAGDDNDDGIEVVANSLTLNGGTIVATDDATGATLDHAALTTTDHEVDVVVTLVSNLGQTATYTVTVQESFSPTETFVTGSNTAGYQITSIAVDVTVPSDTLELSIILTNVVDLGLLADEEEFSYEFTGSVKAAGTQIFTLKEGEFGNLHPDYTYHIFFVGSGAGSVGIGANDDYQEDAGSSEGWDVTPYADFESGLGGSTRFSMNGFPGAEGEEAAEQEGQEEYEGGLPVAAQ